MMAPSKTTVASALAVLAMATSVNAHGYMSVPKTTFAINGDPTQFCATMNGPTTLTAPAGQSFTTDPASNTKAFNAALKSSTYTSMRALVDAKATFISGANKECGVTSPTGAKQPLPAQYVEWAHSDSEGFTPSHQGPCEVWCDDKLAFQDDNCATNYPSAPAKLPYDKTKCTGASMLKIYWLALHSSTWQAYINCAPLEGGSGSSGSTTPSVTPTATSATPTATTATPTATTAKPAATSTPAPASSDDEDCDDELPIAGDEDCDDELDIADTKAPAASTTAPSSTTKAPSSTTKAPATTTAPSDEYDDEYATPAPASSGEVGGDADTGSDEDCDDELPIAGDEDCEDELPIAGEEDCDEELDVAGSESVKTSDLDFSSISTADESAVGTVDAY